MNIMNWFGMEIAYRGFAGTAFYAIVFFFVFENVTLKTAAIRAIELMGCTVVAELSVDIILMLQVQRSDLEGILEETLFWAIALVIARSCELIFLELVNSLSNNKMDKGEKYSNVKGLALLWTKTVVILILFCDYLGGIFINRRWGIIIMLVSLMQGLSFY